jgi:hypothetical protein
MHADMATFLMLPLLVGFTRLGNLLKLDREEMSEAQKHSVSVGRGMERS